MKQQVPRNWYGHCAVSSMLVRLDRLRDRRLHPFWRRVSTPMIPAEVIS